MHIFNSTHFVQLRILIVSFDQFYNQTCLQIL